jgi:hypothetical protein
MKLKGTCHCGAVRFEVPGPPEWLGECNCSFCTRREMLWAYYPAGDFTLVAADGQATYRWSSSIVAHHHCQTCGCGTYSESPSFSDEGPDFSKPRVGVNARLLEGFDLEAAPRRAIDGASFPPMEPARGVEDEAG